MTATSLEARLAPALLALRLGVGLVFFMWTLDKFVNPDHAIRVFQHFYMIPFLTENGSYVVGAVQALLVGSFIAGFLRTWSYGAIFLLHAVSTLTPMANYFNPTRDPAIEIPAPLVDTDGDGLVNAVEFALTLPIFLYVMLGVVDYGYLMMAHAVLDAAVFELLDEREEVLAIECVQALPILWAHVKA